MNFIEACRHFISVDSTPAHGTSELGRWVAAFCRHKGLHVEEHEETIAGVSEVNVIARPVAERPKAEFLLQTHLDTVDPGPFGLWKETGQNPFDAHIIEGKIYGLGVADVKLDFLCKLEAMASFGPEVKWKTPPVLVGTFGEESGMQGALKLIRKNKISAQKALIGEPSDLRLITAAKGFASVEIRIPFTEEEIRNREDHNVGESTSTQSKMFRGKSAHSSTPHLGENAVSKMLESIMMLPDSVNIMEMEGGVNFNTIPGHAFLEIEMTSALKEPISKRLSNIYRSIKQLEIEFLDFKDNDFYPSTPTLSIGMIRTTETEIQIQGICRMPPSITQEIYERWMAGLKKVCEQNNSSFGVNDYKRPYRTSEDSDLVRICKEELASLGLDNKLITQSSTNEASIFSRIGIECVCFGPGKREGNVHTPQEHVAIADLEKATEFYKRIIERFCL